MHCGHTNYVEHYAEMLPAAHSHHSALLTDEEAEGRTLAVVQMLEVEVVQGDWTCIEGRIVHSTTPVSWEVEAVEVGLAKAVEAASDLVSQAAAGVAEAEHRHTEVQNTEPESRQMAVAASIVCSG